MKIKDIKIGTRHRKDLGDINGLADSLKTVGLLQPVVINLSNELIAGERRIAAAKLLGWTEIKTTCAANLDDIALALRAERDENTERKEFTPSEAAALAKALGPYEREAAQKRMTAGIPSVKFTEGNGRAPTNRSGNAIDKVAEAVGMSRPTLTKATAAAERFRNAIGHLANLPASAAPRAKAQPKKKNRKK